MVKNHISKVPTSFEDLIENMSMKNRVSSKIEAAKFEPETKTIDGKK